MKTKFVRSIASISLAGIVMAVAAACGPGYEERDVGYEEREGIGYEEEGLAEEEYGEEGLGYGEGIGD